jgi:hypothetical protein
LEPLIPSAASEKMNGENYYCDDQHDVNYPANRFLQKNKTQQPEHQQHAPDNQKHLVTPMRFPQTYGNSRRQSVCQLGESDMVASLSRYRDHSWR